MCVQEQLRVRSKCHYVALNEGASVWIHHSVCFSWLKMFRLSPHNSSSDLKLGQLFTLAAVQSPESLTPEPSHDDPMATRFWQTSDFHLLASDPVSHSLEITSFKSIVSQQTQKVADVSAKTVLLWKNLPLLCPAIVSTQSVWVTAGEGPVIPGKWNHPEWDAALDIVWWKSRILDGLIPWLNTPH